MDNDTLLSFCDIDRHVTNDEIPPPGASHYERDTEGDSSDWQLSDINTNDATDGCNVFEEGGAVEGEGGPDADVRPAGALPPSAIGIPSALLLAASCAAEALVAGYVDVWERASAAPVATGSSGANAVAFYSAAEAEHGTLSTAPVSKPASSMRGKRHVTYMVLAARMDGGGGGASPRDSHVPAVWTVFRRYRDFKKLGEALRKYRTVVGSEPAAPASATASASTTAASVQPFLQLPPFPGKSWRLGPPDAEFLSRRRAGLATWLTAVMHACAIQASPLVAKGSAPSTTMAPSDVASGGAGGGCFLMPDELRSFLCEGADVTPPGLDMKQYAALVAGVEARAVEVTGPPPSSTPATSAMAVAPAASSVIGSRSALATSASANAPVLARTSAATHGATSAAAAQSMHVILTPASPAASAAVSPAGSHGTHPLLSGEVTTAAAPASPAAAAAAPVSLTSSSFLHRQANHVVLLPSSSTSSDGAIPIQELCSRPPVLLTGTVCAITTTTANTLTTTSAASSDEAPTALNGDGSGGTKKRFTLFGRHSGSGTNLAALLTPATHSPSSTGSSGMINGLRTVSPSDKGNSGSSSSSQHTGLSSTHSGSSTSLKSLVTRSASGLKLSIMLDTAPTQKHLVLPSASAVQPRDSSTSATNVPPHDASGANEITRGPSTATPTIMTSAPEVCAPVAAVVTFKVSTTAPVAMSIPVAAVGAGASNASVTSGASHWQLHRLLPHQPAAPASALQSTVVSTAPSVTNTGGSGAPPRSAVDATTATSGAKVDHVQTALAPLAHDSHSIWSSFTTRQTSPIATAAAAVSAGTAVSSTVQTVGSATNALVSSVTPAFALHSPTPGPSASHQHATAVGGSSAALLYHFHRRSVAAASAATAAVASSAAGVISPVGAELTSRRGDPLPSATSLPVPKSVSHANAATSSTPVGAALPSGRNAAAGASTLAATAGGANAASTASGSSAPPPQSQQQSQQQQQSLLPSDSRRQSQSPSIPAHPLPPPSRPSVGLDDFELMSVLGTGSFGKVLLVRRRRPPHVALASSIDAAAACAAAALLPPPLLTPSASAAACMVEDEGRLYAMKVLAKRNIMERNQVAHTLTERRVLTYTRHPFIVGLHYAFQTRDKLFLVLEFAAGGELFYHLSRAGPFAERAVRFYASELVLALGHLHSRGVVYRDLKPENVLLSGDGHVKRECRANGMGSAYSNCARVRKFECTCMSSEDRTRNLLLNFYTTAHVHPPPPSHASRSAVADFGLAKEGLSSPTGGTSSFCGTPEYLAPEVLNRTGHGFSVDWWALGMVLFELLFGLPPWYTRDRMALYTRIRTAPLLFPSDIPVSEDARDLLRGLLERDPGARLGARGDAAAVAAHAFFNGVNWADVLAKKTHPPFVPMAAAAAVAAAEAAASAGSAARPGSGVGAVPAPAGAAAPPTSIVLMTHFFESEFTNLPVDLKLECEQQSAGGHTQTNTAQAQAQAQQPRLSGSSTDATADKQGPLLQGVAGGVGSDAGSSSNSGGGGMSSEPPTPTGSSSRHLMLSQYRHSSGSGRSLAASIGGGIFHNFTFEAPSHLLGVMQAAAASSSLHSDANFNFLLAGGSRSSVGGGAELHVTNMSSSVATTPPPSVTSAAAAAASGGFSHRFERGDTGVSMGSAGRWLSGDFGVGTSTVLPPLGGLHHNNYASYSPGFPSASSSPMRTAAATAEANETGGGSGGSVLFPSTERRVGSGFDDDDDERALSGTRNDRGDSDALHLRVHSADGGHALSDGEAQRQQQRQQLLLLGAPPRSSILGQPSPTNNPALPRLPLLYASSGVSAAAVDTAYAEGSGFGESSAALMWLPGKPLPVAPLHVFPSTAPTLTSTPAAAVASAAPEIRRMPSNLSLRRLLQMQKEQAVASHQQQQPFSRRETASSIGSVGSPPPSWGGGADSSAILRSISTEIAAGVASARIGQQQQQQSTIS